MKLITIFGAALMFHLGATLACAAESNIVHVPTPFQPKADNFDIGVHANGGGVKFDRLQVHELRSIWK
jgi:hypothetical protein